MSRPSARADIFYAIADPTLRALLDQLQQGEQSVTHSPALRDVFTCHFPALTGAMRRVSQSSGRQRFTA